MATSTGMSMEDLFAARTAYLNGDAAPVGVRPAVLASWDRCRVYGVDPDHLPRQVPEPRRIAAAAAAHGTLLRAAAPFLSLVNETLSGNPHVVALADPGGLILDVRFGSGLERLEDANIMIGASWHEADIGCNGIGTCLAIDAPVILIGPEHFQASYLEWTCIGVPLRDAAGRVVGALDFSVPREASHTHHWGWILSVAKGIEISLANGGVGGRAEAALAAGEPVDPVGALKAVFDLLASGFDVAPTHAAYLAQARERLRDVQVALEDALARSAASERRVRGELEELRSIYASAPVGLCVVDNDLRFVRVNDRLAEMNGLPAGQHIGRTIREVVPTLADVTEPVLRDVFTRGEPTLGLEFSGVTAAAPGVIRHWIDHILPLRDDSGEVTALNVVVEDVTERRNAEQQLKEAYEAARRAVEERDSVLAIVSHDLRNPLNAINMAGELLSMDLSREKRESQLMVIRRSAATMKQLVEDLLDAANIEAGGLRLQRRRVAVEQLLEDAAAGMAPLAAARSQQLIVGVPVGTYVSADRKRILQVLSNLLSNAMAHAPDGGEIGLVAELRDCGGGEVCITVTDTGPGLPEEERALVFDRFWQGRNTRSAGAGLGLAIARGIVEAHGGRIWVDSAPGGGAAFSFVLPARAS